MTKIVAIKSCQKIVRIGVKQSCRIDIIPEFSLFLSQLFVCQFKRGYHVNQEVFDFWFLAKGLLCPDLVTLAKYQ